MKEETPCGHSGPDGAICDGFGGHDGLHEGVDSSRKERVWTRDFKVVRNRTTWRAEA